MGQVRQRACILSIKTEFQFLQGRSGLKNRGLDKILENTIKEVEDIIG